MSRIVQVTVDFAESRGGASRSVMNFNEVTGSHVISINDPALEAGEGPNIMAIRAYGATLAAMYAWSPRSALREAERLLRAADLIICHQLFRFHVQWACGIARKCGIPYWIVPHGCLDPYVFTYRGIRKRTWMSVFGQTFLSNAAAVVFATEGERTKASAQYRIPSGTVIHWPVEAIPNLDHPRARSALLDRFQIPPDSRIVLYMGRLHSVKRPYETIDAVAAAADPRLHLVMVGPNGDINPADLTAYAGSRGFRNLHLPGPLYGADKFSCYAGADLFISLSAKENFGYTIAEAMASRLPVLLGSDLDLAAELRTVGCGWFLADSTVAQAAAALREFAGYSDSQLKACGVCGSSWVRNRCSHTGFADAITRLADKAGISVIQADAFSNV